MANFANYQEGKAAMLMLETQQRAIGDKPAANGDTSVGEPPSSLLNSSGAPFHQHLPPSDQQTAQPKGLQQQQCRYQAPQHFDNENHQESPSSVKPAHEHVAATSSHTQATSVATAVAVNAGAAAADGVGDIKKCGYLRKQKHGHKRFFVLRSSSHLGPGRLEYYDSEKKFRSSLRSAAAVSSGVSSAGAAATASPSKRVIYLYQCFTVNKRADSKNKHLIALYTKDEYFAIVAENEQEQEDWYMALSELMGEGKKGHMDADELDDGYGTVTPGTVFKEVWQVNVKPKGLGQTKNLTGVYRLCLSAKTIHLVKLNSETPCVNLQLMNIRRCGHSESFFFIEVGRSSSIGPGELWMQVDDSVVAQNMHETILETMKALKAFTEFRPRSKSQSSGSNPMPFITMRRHLGNLPPSQTGLQRRSRTESVVGTPPSSKSSGASGYRFRTSSEGEGTMNRPFRSVTGSLIHLNAARANLGRQDSSGGATNRYVRAPPSAAIYHARSASLPVSHFPATTSPVSVSSSSGHGSVTDTITRPSSASICGSPSDGGFNSSDEYGSSPGDFRYFRVRSNTPDSLSNTPPIREEHCLRDYMAMGWNRDMSGCSGGEVAHDESAEEDSRTGSLRRRTPSFSRQVGSGSAGCVAVYQKMTQTNFLLDEAAAEGSALGSSSQATSTSSSLRSEYSSSSEHSQDRPPLVRAPDSFKDDGYMPMMAGVVPSQRDADYMPMQPSTLLSATPPKQSTASPSSRHVDSQGYMMMLPGGGSRTDSSAPASPHISSRAVNRRGTGHPEKGEYMDMSKSRPMAGGHKLSNDAYYTLTTPETLKSSSSYFSLPRSYKAPARDRTEHDEYVPMSSPAKPACDPTTSTCEYDGTPPPGFAPQHNGCSDELVTDPRVARPNRLLLSRRSCHEEGRPSSPGEYINIEFGEQALQPACPITIEDSIPVPSVSRACHRSPLPQEYMSIEVDGLPPKSQSPRPSLVAPWNPPTYVQPSASSSSHHDGVTVGRPDDYTEMSFRRREESQSPSAMLQHLCVLEQCYPSSTPRAEPKVIRADPQGRRRHSSETFVTLATVAGGDGADVGVPVPSSDPQAAGSKWQGSPSFDTMWMCVDSTAAGEPAGFCLDQAEASVSSLRTERTVEHQNGINYIALDLKEDLLPGSTHDAHPSSPSSLPLPENRAYTSIDYTKPEGIAAATKD
ncbi:insulin receptor substrate 2-B [Electrophorus electricus]|uniref:Insulin receptor substrate 2-B-like n=1 Tax=Electrophorus electricus TaxID=8005 RepID=A0A4W4FAT2_ELEEL|nr:insulin receptor substrate 2-B [Electrophorus electricus]